MKLKNVWEFNKLEIENFNNPQERLYNYFSFIKKNYKKLEGDIFEFGVFRGRSIIGTALLLKSLGSNKKIYGFDSFCGLSSFTNEKDELKMFDEMYKNNQISEEHYESYKRHKIINKFKNISNECLETSTSKNFSNTSLEYVKKKIKFFNLDNIILIKGSFSDSLKKFKNTKIFCSNIDCDLYDSYKECLPFVYDNMVNGGYIHLDEYYSLKFPGAKIFCDEFCKEKNIKVQKYEDSIIRWPRCFIIK